MKTLPTQKLAETTGGALWAPYAYPYAPYPAYAPVAVPLRPAFRPHVAAYWAPGFAWY